MIGARPWVLTRSRTIAAVVLLVVAGGSTAPAAPKAKWGVKPDPPAAELKISVAPGQALPVHSGIKPIYPTVPSAFVAVGGNDKESDTRVVFDLRTFQPAGTIQGAIESGSSSLVRLSGDGKLLAATVTDADPDRAIEIWSFADGKQLQRIEPKPRPKRILQIDFVGNDKLVVVTETANSGKAVQFYETATGKLLRPGALSPKIQERALAVSPGGKLLAVALDNAVSIVDVESGKALGDLAIAGGSCSGLSFSHDGAELAALLNQQSGTRLMAWDLTRGEVVANHPLPGGPNFSAPGWSSFVDNNLEWMADGSAWLLNGHALVNRKDGRWVWSLFAPPYADPRTGRMPFGTDVFVYTQGVHLLDNDHALAGLGGKGVPHRLEVVSMPWPTIDATLKAVESGAPALLRPGGSLSLQFQIGAVRHATPHEAQAELTKELTDCLAAQGFQVADGQPVVLHVKHAEEPGPEYRTMGTLRGSQPGIVSTKFVDELSITVGTSTAPVWSERKAREGLGYFVSGFRIGNVVNEASLRKAGFEALKNDLRSMGMPYFIPLPKDKGLSILPGLTVLAPSPTARMTGAAAGTTKARPTTRGQTPKR